MRLVPSVARLVVVLSAAVALGFSASVAKAQQSVKPAAHPTFDMTVVKPETVGFSSEGLERLHQFMQQAVDQKQVAGIVTILARHGKVVDYSSYGYRDMAAGAPMTKDVIFRDFSMTKPVTGVAMMILYQQGKWLPSDPIAKFIPEFAHLKVYKGVDSAGNVILTDPDHPPTMRELMSHTAGFTYGFFGDTPVDKMYRDAQPAGLGKPAGVHRQAGEDSRCSISRGRAGPTACRWMSRDTLSKNSPANPCPISSGTTFSARWRCAMQASLFLQISGDRFTVLYRTGPNGELEADASASRRSGDYDVLPPMASGGGGMVSTAEDYFRFASMLLNEGELDGKRILAPATVKMMTSNHVPSELLNGQIRHWRCRDASRIWIRLQRRGRVQSRRSKPARRQRDVPVGWRGRHMVLGRSHE